MYEYDALGRRIERSGQGTVTFYYYDGNRIIEEHTGPDETATALRGQYVYGLDYIDEHVAYFGPPDPATEVQILYFALTDANYNVVALVDQAGNTFEQYSYEPYGDLFAAEQGHDGDSMLYAVGDPNNPDDPTDPNDPNATAPLVYLFGHQGLLRDPLVGLIHNRAREYNLALMRFNQRDPYETALVMTSVLRRNGQSMGLFASLSGAGQFTDGLNLYTYAGNNSMSNHDPSGEIIPLLIVAGAIGGAIFESMRIYATGADLDPNENIAARIGAAAIVGAMFGLGIGEIGAFVAPALGLTAGQGAGLVTSMLGIYAAGPAIKAKLNAVDDIDDALANLQLLGSGVTTLGGAYGVLAGVRMPMTGRINPWKIRTLQSSIKPRFDSGKSIRDLAAGLRSGRIKPTSIPRIRVFIRNGVIWTLDHRRLVAFRMAGKRIPFRRATESEIAKESGRKNSTTTGGRSIRIRGEN